MLSSVDKTLRNLSFLLWGTYFEFDYFADVLKLVWLCCKLYMTCDNAGKVRNQKLCKIQTKHIKIDLVLNVGVIPWTLKFGYSQWNQNRFDPFWWKKIHFALFSRLISAMCFLWILVSRNGLVKQNSLLDVTLSGIRKYLTLFGEKNPLCAFLSAKKCFFLEITNQNDFV